MLIVVIGAGAGLLRYGTSFFPDALRIAMSFIGGHDFDPTVQAKVTLVRSDMRSLATALESYHSDYNAYPSALETLTTPAAYLKDKLIDPFTAPLQRRFFTGGQLDTLALRPQNNGTLPYAYYPTEKGWLLWSPGPDLDCDITDPAGVCDENTTLPCHVLAGLTYDPSNGIMSNGDIYRVKE